MKTSKMWRTAKVFTKALGFGVNAELEERRIITIRPDENRLEALIREGYDIDSRIEIIS